MMHCISCSVAGCRMPIGALTRGAWLGGCGIASAISRNGCLDGHNLADEKFAETFEQDVDWLPWQGHGLLSAQVGVDNIEEFLIGVLVVTDQVCVVVTFRLSDQIIHIAMPLHEDVITLSIEVEHRVHSGVWKINVLFAKCCVVNIKVPCQ